MNFQISDPKKHRSWLFALIMIAVLFGIYYTYFFPALEKIYIEKFWTSKMVCDQEKGKFDKLYIKIQVPRWINTSVSRKIPVTIVNRTSKEISVDFVLYPREEEDSYKNLLVYRKWDDSEAGNYSSNEIRDLPLYHGATAKMLFFTQLMKDSDDIEINHQFRLAGTITVDDEDKPCYFQLRTQPIRYNPGKAFIDSFINIILMPPWSNTFLIPIAIFLTVFFEKKKMFQNNFRGVKGFVSLVFLSTLGIAFLFWLTYAIIKYYDVPVFFKYLGGGLVFIYGYGCFKVGYNWIYNWIKKHVPILDRIHNGVISFSQWAGKKLWCFKLAPLKDKDYVIRKETTESLRQLVTYLNRTEPLSKLELNYIRIERDHKKILHSPDLSLLLIDSIRNMPSSDFKCQEISFIKRLMDLVEKIPSLAFSDEVLLLNILMKLEFDDIDKYLIEKLETSSSVELRQKISNYLTKQIKKKDKNLLNFICVIVARNIDDATKENDGSIKSTLTFLNSIKSLYSESTSVFDRITTICEPFAIKNKELEVWQKNNLE